MRSSKSEVLLAGEAHPQNVISGRETYVDEYRGSQRNLGPAGYNPDERSMSTLPLQNEIVFNELRPESMYGNEYQYENTGGYQRDSRDSTGGDGVYQGEIRLGTMRQPTGSTGSEQVHETRYL